MLVVMLTAETGTYDNERTTKLSTPLRHESNKHTFSIALLLEHSPPRTSPISFKLLSIELKLLLNLIVLLFRNQIFWIIGRPAKTNENRPRFFTMALGHEPSRR